MAITKISNSSLKNLNKYDSMLAGNTAYIPNYYQSIATVTVGAGGLATASFTSIPQTYKHLQIRGFFNQGGGNWINTTYNSDTTAGAYQWHYPYGDGSSATAGYSGSSSATSTVCAYNANATNFGSFVFDILDYTNTSKNKVGRSITGMDANGSGFVMAPLSNLWINTAAITRIDLASSGTFAQYSHFALYGIKGA
jgi:hypothetical protein